MDGVVFFYYRKGGGLVSWAWGDGLGKGLDWDGFGLILKQGSVWCNG